MVQHFLNYGGRARIFGILFLNIKKNRFQKNPTNSQPIAITRTAPGIIDGTMLEVFIKEQKIKCRYHEWPHQPPFERHRYLHSWLLNSCIHLWRLFNFETYFRVSLDSSPPVVKRWDTSLCYWPCMHSPWRNWLHPGVCCFSGLIQCGLRPPLWRLLCIPDVEMRVRYFTQWHHENSPMITYGTALLLD